MKIYGQNGIDENNSPACMQAYVNQVSDFDIRKCGLAFATQWTTMFPYMNYQTCIDTKKSQADCVSELHTSDIGSTAYWKGAAVGKSSWYSTEQYMAFWDPVRHVCQLYGKLDGSLVSKEDCQGINDPERGVTWGSLDSSNAVAGAESASQCLKNGDGAGIG